MWSEPYYITCRSLEFWLRIQDCVYLKNQYTEEPLYTGHAGTMKIIPQMIHESISIRLKQVSFIDWEVSFIWGVPYKRFFCMPLAGIWICAFGIWDSYNMYLPLPYHTVWLSGWSSGVWRRPLLPIQPPPGGGGGRGQGRRREGEAGIRVCQKWADSCPNQKVSQRR